jgi:hypothetical protein
MIFLCSFLFFPSISQHLKIPVIDFSGKDYESVTDHTILKKGEIKCYRDHGTFAELVIDGGTLLISGKLSIKKLTVHRGLILITKTGTAVLPALHLNGNAAIINYGSVVYTGDVTLSKSHNHIYNEGTKSRMNWGSSELDFSSKKSSLINNGTMDIGTLKLNSKTGKFFMGPNSLTNVVNLENKYQNRVFISAGIAKLSQSGYALLPKSLTSSHGLLVCPGPFSDVLPVPGSSAGSGYGKANVMEKGCTSFPPIVSHTSNSH